MPTESAEQKHALPLLTPQEIVEGFAAFWAVPLSDMLKKAQTDQEIWNLVNNYLVCELFNKNRFHEWKVWKAQKIAQAESHPDTLTSQEYTILAFDFFYKSESRKEAIHFFKKAGSEKNSDALILLDKIEKSLNNNIPHEEIDHYLEQLEKLNTSFSLYVIGSIYSDDNDTLLRPKEYYKKDTEKVIRSLSLQYFKRAAALGAITAEQRVGPALYMGLLHDDVAKEEGRRAYCLSTQKGSMLSLHFLLNIGEPSDLLIAIEERCAFLFDSFPMLCSDIFAGHAKITMDTYMPQKNQQAAQLQPDVVDNKEELLLAIQNYRAAQLYQENPEYLDMLKKLISILNTPTTQYIGWIAGVNDIKLTQQSQNALQEIYDCWLQDTGDNVLKRIKNAAYQKMLALMEQQEVAAINSPIISNIKNKLILFYLQNGNFLLILSLLKTLDVNHLSAGENERLALELYGCYEIKKDISLLTFAKTHAEASIKAGNKDAEIFLKYIETRDQPLKLQQLSFFSPPPLTKEEEKKNEVREDEFQKMSSLYDHFSSKLRPLFKEKEKDNKKLREHLIELEHTIGFLAEHASIIGKRDVTLISSLLQQINDESKKLNLPQVILDSLQEILNSMHSHLREIGEIIKNNSFRTSQTIITR